MSGDGLRSLDAADFDRAAEPLERVLPALLALHPPEVLEAAPLPRRGGPLQVSALVAHGRPGLAVATRWLLEQTPRAKRAPLPAHEQWDGLLTIHQALPEAAWLVAELLGSLSATQGSLGRRIALGVERRFGERGVRLARLRLADGPHAGLL